MSHFTWFPFLSIAGVYLPKFCEAQGANARRGMAEIKSSGLTAPPAESPQYANVVSFLGAPAVPPTPC